MSGPKSNDLASITFLSREFGLSFSRICQQPKAAVFGHQ
jgi:hypothetical protein